MTATPGTLTKPFELWSGRHPIPMVRFGSDHWHQLLHVGEHGAVTRLHWRDGPTFLVDAELWGHTDVDVLTDLAAAGLVALFGGERRPSTAGRAAQEALRRHLADGGNYVNFAVQIRDTVLPLAA